MQITNNEPLFVGMLVASVTGAGAWIGILLHKGLNKLDKLDRWSLKTDIAIFGNERDPKPNGVLRTVSSIGEKLDGHINTQNGFNAGLTKAMGEHHKLLEQHAQCPILKNRENI